MKTALVAIAGGDAYLKYAEALMESAATHFQPTEEVEFHIIPGEEGWPAGTMCRHTRLLDQMPRADYVFLCDADMRFEGPCGPEILPGNFGLTATLHPGYVGKPRHELPYETRPSSSACVAPDEGGAYYAGGFIGGTRAAMEILSRRIAVILGFDSHRGVTPVYHDESALNRILVSEPPALTLSPAYAHPDNDAYYKSFWPEDYPRILVALDKTASERGDR